MLAVGYLTPLENALVSIRSKTNEGRLSDLAVR
jgi:hypothetical protein